MTQLWKPGVTLVPHAFGCEQAPSLPRPRRKESIPLPDGGMQDSGRVGGVGGILMAAFGNAFCRRAIKEKELRMLPVCLFLQVA